MRRRLLLLACTLALGATLSALAGAAPRGHGPVTLLSTTHRIVAFAQDGDRIAWLQASAQCDFGPIGSLYERAVTGGPVTVLARSTECTSRPPALVLAGTTALWSSWADGNATYTQLFTAAPSRKTVRLEDPSTGLVFEWDGGAFPGGVAGDRAVLAYSVIVVTKAEGSCVTDQYGDEQCDYEARGATYRVSNGRPAPIKGLGGAVAVAASAPNLAVIPVAVSTYSDPRSDSPIVAPTATTIKVVNAGTGRVVRSFEPTGIPREVALTPSVVAVLVDQPRTRRLEIRSASTGALLRNVPVSRSAHALSGAGGVLVYAVGRDVFALDTATFARTRIAHAAAAPIGLSIEGARVAWAENARGRGSIRAVSLG